MPTPLVAAVALLATDHAERLAALLGEPASTVAHGLQAESARIAPLLAAEGGEAARDAVLRQWLLAEPQAAAEAIARTLTALLHQGQVAAAARLACLHGSAAWRLKLMRQAGWAMLMSPARPWLGRLLDALAVETDEPDDALYALQLAWRIEVLRLPHDAERALRTRPLPDGGLRQLIDSRCAQMYDAPGPAVRHAQAAIAALGPTLEPPALLAQFALGFGLLDAGRPLEAIAPLSAALRGADRDGLAYLQVEALHVLARVHDERADDAKTAECIARAGALAEAHGLPALPSLDSLRRLQLTRALRRWPDEAARATAPTAEDTAGDGFPDLTLDALRLRWAGRHAEAQARVATLREREARSFVCFKWRNELALVELGLAGRHAAGELHARWHDAAPALDALASGEASDNNNNDDTLYPLQHRVLRAGARLLARQPAPLAPPAEWQALDALLAERGLARLRSRLALVGALHPDHAAAAPDALAHWLREPASDMLDALWLAPCLVGPLDRLLASTAMAREPALLARGRALLQHLLQGAPDAADTAAPPAAPPLDLTPREWQVLQLIGQQFSNEQIASHLFVSVATVKTHINRLYAKLGIAQRVEAIQRARALAAGAAAPSTGSFNPPG